MADLRRLSSVRTGAPENGGDGGADRGQLLLVGALALAVLFVALALLLNTAIYTGNLATREAGVDGTAGIDYAGAAESAGVDAVRSVNERNDSSHAALRTALEDTMRAWDDAASHHRATAGDLADVDVVAVTNGTQFRQNDSSRNFTSHGGAENWTLVADSEGVSGVHSIRLAVDATRLTDDPADVVAADVFHVNVSSDVGTRSLFLYNDSGTPTARIVEPAGTTTCAAGSVTDGTVVVNVANASVGGASCPALARLDDTSGSVSVDYRDGGAAGGTYRLVVDEPPSALSRSGFADAGSGQPYWTYGLYAAEFRVTYRTPQLDYAARIEVRPP
ncbi:DUF7261 family protein [Halobellus rubicundus]|uniref:Flp pilus-assembly TadG-like N-terminal domain-containing protein n=1 Tax=Halobellus rubicundus TaxID=2996466 RepID=A0ABD5M8F7_9EURY